MNRTKVTGSASGPATARTVMRGDSPKSVLHARRAARAFTNRLTPALDPATADTLVLVVSELVTNALRHGGGRYTLGLTADPHAITVSVSDPSPTPPQARTPDLTSGTGGLGWPMVRHLTSHLTTVPGPGPGKTIRARLPR
ncbi:ATP-binding protein [Streptomyces sp. B6B3]|uniref:ATP-binding protein n=1 Tax=Streptomyces sp. B6B3 TaxID=3153570 RepID=UPI00325DF96F